jgi:hypothetical protein
VHQENASVEEGSKIRDEENPFQEKSHELSSTIREDDKESLKEDYSNKDFDEKEGTVEVKDGNEYESGPNKPFPENQRVAHGEFMRGMERQSYAPQPQPQYAQYPQYSYTHYNLNQQPQQYQHHYPYPYQNQQQPQPQPPQPNPRHYPNQS